MLSARHRLHHPRDFSAVIRHGVRAGRPALVLHLLLADDVAGADDIPVSDLAVGDLAAGAVPRRPVEPARAGFVVSRAVGGSVVRHRVVRRLRPLVSARIDQVPAGSQLVVRALPPAAAASSVELAQQLDSALASALRKADRVSR